MRALRPGIALFPLRLFLGATFAYAGVQKLSDPGFLHPGSSTYIGTQLEGFANGTPGGFLLHAFALPHPEVSGVCVALFEIVVGVLAMLGLMTRVAALGGAALSLVLFLTASWHTSPYFLGPDLIFAFAWVPFTLTGATDQPALDNLSREPSEAPGGLALTRRSLVAQAAGAALAVAGLAALLKGSYSAPGATASTGDAAATAPNAATSGVPSTAVRLGASSQIPAGQAATYQDPADGQPALLIREPDGSLAAFSAVCTHAGCTVGYQGGVIACPCHGATFNPQTGAVEGGPAPEALARKNVVEHGGSVYAVPS